MKIYRHADSGLTAKSSPEIAGKAWTYGFCSLRFGMMAKVANFTVGSRTSGQAGDEFIPPLNKAGGAGFQATAYIQPLLGAKHDSLMLPASLRVRAVACSYVATMVPGGAP